MAIEIKIKSENAKGMYFITGSLRST